MGFEKMEVFVFFTEFYMWYLLPAAFVGVGIQVYEFSAAKSPIDAHAAVIGILGVVWGLSYF